MLSDKEHRVIDLVGNDSSLTQRGAAEALGFSLGMTNLLLRKLAKTGYLKTVQLNRRKLQYILTPKGMTEKIRKSYNYASRAIAEFSLIKKTIQTEVLKSFAKGARNFTIVGDNELAAVTEQAVKDLSLPGINLKKILSLKENGNRPHFQRSGDCSRFPETLLIAVPGNGKPVRLTGRNAIHIPELLTQNNPGPVGGIAV